MEIRKLIEFLALMPHIKNNFMMGGGTPEY